MRIEVRSLKPETRGLIEAALDRLMSYELLSATRWLEQEMPVKSIKDLCLGYIVGSVRTFAYMVILISEQRVFADEDEREVIGIIRRRLPEIRAKIEMEIGK